MTTWLCGLSLRGVDTFDRRSTWEKNNSTDNWKISAKRKSSWYYRRKYCHWHRLISHLSSPHQLGSKLNHTIGKTLCTGRHVYTSGSSMQHLHLSPPFTSLGILNYITKLLRTWVCSGTDSSALSTRSTSSPCVLVHVLNLVCVHTHVFLDPLL